MNEERRKIEGVSSGDPVRVKLTGGRYFFIALGVMLIWLELYGIAFGLSKSNELREQDLQIKKEQLDLARRQFALDSIAMEQNKKLR